MRRSGNHFRFLHVRYLIVIGLILLLVSCSEIEDDGSRAVIFEDGSLVMLTDSNLATCVQENLAASGASSPSQLETISCDKVTSLDGIESFSGLLNLSITGNDLTDGSPIGALSQLQSLSLQSTNIKDSSFLSNLPELTKLSIIDGQFSEICPIEFGSVDELTLNSAGYLNYRRFGFSSSLTKLDLSRNNINQTTINSNGLGMVITQATNLTELRLDNNAIEFLNFLSSHSLLKILSAGSNNITDLTASFSSLTSLETLDLSNNTISDPSPISGLTTLKSLSLNNNNLADISSLSTLVNLTYLNLGHNEIVNLAPMPSLTQLVELGLKSNQISDLSSLALLVQLKNLWLSSNNFSSVTPLKDMSQLEELELDYSSVSLANFDQLTGLSLLKRLSLYGSSASDCVEVTTLDTALGTGVIQGSDCL